MPMLQDWRGHGVDVAVVGAGAAGIAVARHLAATRPDLSVLVLEASERLGGRALTLTDGSGIDLGCGWLHGGRDNAWTAIADAAGVAVDREPAPWNRTKPDDGPRAVERQAARAAMHDYFDRLDGETLDGTDKPLSAFLEPGGRWNNFIGAVATYINGAELECASTQDYLRYAPGRPPDWRLPDGYGRLIADHAAPVPVVPHAAVSRIAHGGAAVSLETARGRLDCRAAVVTVSSTCLAEEVIRFDPPLPDKQEAAAGVPLGVANKVYLDIAEPEALPAEVYLHGAMDRVDTGAYALKPFGRPWIEGYYGGTLARAIEAMTPEAAAAFAIDELVGIFGADLRRHLRLRVRSVWAGNPWARGSYSYARPGHADARAVLAAPVGDRLFFAGEACSRHRFSTAHGAYETGVAAAQAIAGRL
ncbi:NAD(P)/FAD-dependent oxidoreductase [Lichenihabitans sp. Uapishka_5]|uniref:flavin monoamine oxidase family protein n=1 Tax=Lichenihabitans sp. Uapishka_5 TaxID=3037302 RepID=UPI0029E7E181|nr:NAD(P)/FAD-dependent oxidoreductase [Lichenihabitans sp. Uapishka_5]MDX7952992.1 NAD(P)/FAD-dependent oxidoreductase [Lichenihabitans sp. Uapishka_5]